jgi:hypothetical protein
MMTDEIWKLLESLADRFCERKALYCLFRFLPAYFSPNGLTDGWEECRTALANTRALCRDDLKPDEAEDIHKAMNLLDRMLARSR